ncbi:MAG: amidohydrolase family protein [Mycobacterium sp.]
MSAHPSTSTLYPPEGFGAPKHRRGHAGKTDVGLPAGTEVFSADNHITIADDIFYERFPDNLKDKAPRIWYQDGAYHIGVNGQSFLWDTFSAVVMQYDDLPGAASNNMDARIQELRDDGVDKELAFPNAILALFHYPDREVRELAFRVYNEYIAELQERSNGHFYGVGLINWWDPQGARRTLSELKSLGLKTYLLPLNPGKDAEDNPIDYASTAMTPVWDEIEDAGLPLTHHIGETPPKIPSEFNTIVVSMMTNIDGFREVFSKYIFGGILDRHPGLRIGWFEGGIAWVPWALQDAEHLVASYQHMYTYRLQHDIQYYWDTHMSASFMVDPLGLQSIDRIGVDKVFWSSDYPHNESTFGYSEKSLAALVEAVGPQNAARICSDNIKHFLGISE